MKRKICILFIYSFVSFLFSQEIESMLKIDYIRHQEHRTDESPFGIFVDEVNNKIDIMNGNWDGGTRISLTNCNEFEEINDYTSCWEDCNIRFGNEIISFSDSLITIQKEKKIYVETKLQSGISFILKKDNGYIIYYVDQKGIPGAVDTTGRIYTNIEAIEYLKQYDSEKFEQSLSRAKELGLYDKFIKNEVLVWGQTYYSTTYIKEALYEKGKFPYLNHGLILYDNSGYSYQIRLMYQDSLSKLCIVSPTGEDSIKIPLKGYSDMIYNDNSWVSTSWYVGFGGNIYYYIAGEEYTEVFRIRRTWGAPDFYAMAINGYTEDEYGKYVDEVLPKLSKADLRLLRNTIFALYGVHFKSEDLSKHFDKQVWYIDEGKTSAEVTLPAHRQKLVEMIQKLESK